MYKEKLSTLIIGSISDQGQVQPVEFSSFNISSLSSMADGRQFPLPINVDCNISAQYRRVTEC